jgi:gliding motility-associated-like protein
LDLNTKVNGNLTSPKVGNGFWASKNSLVKIVDSAIFIPFSRGLQSNFEGPYNFTYHLIDSNGCEDVEDYQVTIRNQPTVSIIASNPSNACENTPFVINAMSAYCDQQVAWKTINHADGSLCDGTWTQQSNSENIRFTNGKNDFSKKRAQLSVTTLPLIGDDCPSATDTILIKLNPNPILSNISDQLGCAPLSAIWTVDELNNLSPDQVTYSWELGSGKISSQQIPGKINYDIPGKFNIRVIATSDSGNCADTNFAQVFVYPKPMAAFSTNPEKPTVATAKIQMMNQSIIDTNTFNHKLSYRWDFGNTNQNSDTSLLCSPYYHHGKDTGKFNITLIVTSPYNCSDTAIKSIYIKPSLSIYIPNAFTPNNTGPSVNNTFKPITGSYLKAQFSIYNRWGEKLFETNNLTNGWDGKSNGLDCEEGTYLYKLVIFDKDFQSYQYHGTFTLLR